MIKSLYEYGKHESTDFSDEKIKRFKTYLDEIWQSRKQYSLPDESDDSFYGTDKKNNVF